MLANLNGWHAVILLVIILLLFGAPKLPGLAKSLGQSMKIFKAEVKSEPSEPASPQSTNDASTGSNPDGSVSSASAADERTAGSQTQPKP